MHKNMDSSVVKAKGNKGKACLIAMPLIPLPLIFLPMDFFTSRPWAVAFGSFVYAIGKLLMMTMAVIRGKERPSGWMLSPVLCIVLLPAVVKLHGMSARSADGFAQKTAETVHALCTSTGKCPDAIEGFNCGGPGSCNARSGAYGTTYPVLYRREENPASFRIAVRHNIDSYFVVTGGKGKELKTEQILDSRRVRHGDTRT
ncbi:MAG: hypothetical protein OEW15_13935 [Nitrospirota bacterium]|nr:hypothetical protein [Nitrospirota bacterium]